MTFACVCGATPLITAATLRVRITNSSDFVCLPGVAKRSLASARQRGDVDASEVRKLRARRRAIRVKIA